MSDGLWQNEKLGTNDFIGLTGPKETNGILV